MKTYLIKNTPSLIGDFMGVLPVLQELSNRGNKIYIDVNIEINDLVKVVTEKYNIHLIDNYEKEDCIEIEYDISKAFNDAHKNNQYMSEAAWEQILKEKPSIIPKAYFKYEIPNIDIKDFYILAPFARSLPNEQKWQQEKWQELVNDNYDLSFIVFGSKHDPKNFIKGNNVTECYGESFKKIFSLLKKSKGVISVVTGISHLCFHLDVKNIILCNQQGKWGRNPNGIFIENYIPEIIPEQINKHLKPPIKISEIY